MEGLEGDRALAVDGPPWPEPGVVSRQKPTSVAPKSRSPARCFRRHSAPGLFLSTDPLVGDWQKESELRLENPEGVEVAGVEEGVVDQSSSTSDDDFVRDAVQAGFTVDNLFQACALLLDDIMDNSHTRRDQICWYRRPEVGLKGINDGILLKCHALLMIKKYFREKPYFVDLLELWDEIALQTSLGQMLDLIGTHSGADDLAKYSIEGYRRIVKYKTSYYSFYLPVACALLLSGAKQENFSGLKDILIELGIYFQIQDYYLDCFADPNAVGKIGTDIEDHKCSWLIVQALRHADNNQIEALQNNYGKKDSTSVSKVKSTYTALDLHDIFSEFERRCYKHLVSSIEAQQDRAAQEILKSLLKKIHQRKKLLMHNYDL